MSKGLQWVIGIVLVVMAAAFVFANVAPFFLARAVVARAAARPAGSLPGFLGLLFGAGRFGVGAPLFALRELLSCLWPLLLVGLIIWAFSALAARPAPMAAMPPYMPPAPPAPAAQAVCPNCGQPLQAGWRHCPNCGQALGQ